jgi:penicillin-insensitive murein endopeptidase
MPALRRLFIILVSLFALSAFSGAVLISDAHAVAKKTVKKPTKKTSAKKKSASKSKSKKKPTKKKKKKKSKKPRYSFVIPVPKDPGTQSVGVTSHGRLYNPSQIPITGETFRVRKSNQNRHTNYANQSLVDVLQYAADKVHEKDPTAVLYTGDAAAEKGGQLSSHKSHQSGLDADISLYTRDSEGKLKPDGEFFKFNASGKTYDGKYTLDADLSWVFVEALLTSPHAQIQYLFIYNPLKQLILDAGRRANADPKIIERASFVMQQPGDSTPHAEHFHIRIYCPAKDIVDGCMVSSIIWPWVENIKPTSLSHVASYASDKSGLVWSVDGSDMSECYDGEKDPNTPGEPLDGDYLCVDPEAYEDFLAPPEDSEDETEPEATQPPGDGD